VHEKVAAKPDHTATSQGDYSLEAYILGTNHYQIELLTNLWRGYGNCLTGLPRVW
jgi:hypothetical protein